MLVQRQMTPGWVGDPVWRQDGYWWRGCRVRMGLTPPEVHSTAGVEVGMVQ